MRIITIFIQWEGDNLAWWKKNEYSLEEFENELKELENELENSYDDGAIFPIRILDFLVGRDAFQITLKNQSGKDISSIELRIWWVDTIGNVDASTLWWSGTFKDGSTQQITHIEDNYDSSYTYGVFIVDYT